MLYNPRNYQKSINKSIRLSQPVYDYIMQAPGDGFNQKFENIIIDAKESEARRQETLKMLDDRIEDLQADYNSCYDKLRKLEPMVQAALHINSLIKEFDSSVGKILEDARKRVSQVLIRWTPVFILGYKNNFTWKVKTPETSSPGP